MRISHRACFVFEFCVAVLSILIIAGCGGGGGTSSNPTPPDISSFVAVPDDIMPGDSVSLEFTVTGADSLVLTSPRQKLTNTGTGSIYVKPIHPTRYTLYAYNRDGQDSANLLIPMAGAVPLIQSADLSADTIVQRDTATLTYSVLRADSIILTPTGKLASASSGSLKLSPIGNVNYTMIAYNGVGTDTAKMTLTVEIPHILTAVNGPYYTGQLGLSGMSPQLAFTCQGPTGQTLFKPWIHLVRLVGDGHVSVDSLQPAANGVAVFDYTFTDTVGYALLEAYVRGFDTTDVSARADLIRPGLHGQGQFVMFDETYAMVKAMNGLPAGTIVGNGVTFVSYYSALGLYYVLEDPNSDGHASDNEGVLGVIAVSGYHGATNKGVGVGAHYADVVAAYGNPEEIEKDTLDTPNVWVLYYSHQGLYFYARLSDTTVVQIDAYEVTTTLADKPRPFPLMKSAN